MFTSENPDMDKTYRETPTVTATPAKAQHKRSCLNHPQSQMENKCAYIVFYMTESWPLINLPNIVIFLHKLRTKQGKK